MLFIAKPIEQKLLFIVIICLLASLISCGQRIIKITDYYTIYSEDEFGAGYHLICKLGCNNDAKIENIKSIRWNTKNIIIKKRQSGRYQWYRIKARGNELRCCNNDELTGPLNEAEVNLIIKKERLYYMNEQTF